MMRLLLVAFTLSLLPINADAAKKSFVQRVCSYVHSTLSWFKVRSPDKPMLTAPEFRILQEEPGLIILEDRRRPNSTVKATIDPQGDLRLLFYQSEKNFAIPFEASQNRRGEEALEFLIEQFGDQIRSITTEWSQNEALGHQFQILLNTGTTPPQAATRIFTGRLIVKLGYTRIESIQFTTTPDDPQNFQTKVRFTKP